MGMKWTLDQQRVIDSRGRNLLVSAAAGSGKTAVLVERIIQMITTGEEPFHIDQLLVMSFTNAAASEMRERIGMAIEKRLALEPDNEHLQLQSALVPYASITTIDSFCLSLIRNHFDQLELDPSFRIGDLGEMQLLETDVMAELLEAYYQSKEEAFFEFVEAFSTGKADYGIEECIKQVYTFSQSHPWPREWINGCRQELQNISIEQLEQTPWMDFFRKDLSMQVREMIEQLEGALSVCLTEGGPLAYEPMLRSDIEMLEELLHLEGYLRVNQCLNEMSFVRLASIRSKEIDPELKEYVSSTRDRIKKMVSKMKGLYCFDDPKEMLEDLKQTKDHGDMLLRLALSFEERFSKSKRERNVVDFSDLEHFALEILLREENGIRVPTQTADLLAEQFVEILVDEYQDSNEVQEALVKAISRERFGKPNVFMVGDVKQSIYKFRLAKPELFLEKYESYESQEGLYQKIELHQNFRSRPEVLSGINDVFFRIMTRNLGNIHYTEETALHPGATFMPTEQTIDVPKLLMMDIGSESLKFLDEEMEDYTSKELEAKLIAHQIKKMTHKEDGIMVWDKEEEGYRRATYGDVVILLRSLSGWTEVFLNVLLNEGIPAYAESRTGYFNAIEIETVLSLLAVIDNPMQDIPLAAVMKSPIFSITNQELAVMVGRYKKEINKGQDRGIYGALLCYLASDMKDELYEKLVFFDTTIKEFQKKAWYLSLDELLHEVYEKTGYYDFVRAMPAGDIRRANLNMLVEKAVAYEKTSYQGLFHFIRYIEKLKKYDTDFGEASVGSGGEQTVRLMSIHKSKGLEFPIVFLAGMGKTFNKRDSYGKILIDPDFGIALDCFDLKKRLKSVTLKKQVLKRRMELDALGEELRILYVAMTRARECLIMTAVDKNLQKKIEKWRKIAMPAGYVPFTILSLATSYFDWMLMCLSDTSTRVIGEEILVSSLVEEEVYQQVQKAVSKEELLCFDSQQVYNEEYETRLSDIFSFQYPYEEDLTLNTKLSVSELKRYDRAVEEEVAFLPTIPSFMREEEQQLGGVYRGSAYHRVLELLNFSIVDTNAQLEGEIKRLQEEGKLSREAAKLIQIPILLKFLLSPLGGRMKKASENGCLHREKQFVIGVAAKEIQAVSSEELILIQGIIDAYLELDEGLILIDYKTDRVKKGEESLLKDRYQTQLSYYKRALEQMTGKKVVECIIYSFALQAEIYL